MRSKLRQCQICEKGCGMSDAYQVVRDFEQAVAAYTGAPYCVAVSSCTSALTLAVAWHLRGFDETKQGDGMGNTSDIWYERVRTPIEIPKRTYVSVPMSIIHAGGRPVFRDEEWLGGYQLRPLQVFDCARRFTSGMYGRPVNETDYANADGNRQMNGRMQCVSFHASKTLGDTQGGAILLDDPEADAWLRRARFDGRTEGVAPKDDTFTQIGWHCYMSPDVAARLLLKLSVLPRHNDPLPNDDYPDLSTMEIFR